jgi:hypothetical protein
MQRITFRESIWLGLGAAAVTSLGIAMHLEHREMHGACNAAPTLDAEGEASIEPTLDIVLVPEVAEPNPPAATSLTYGPAFSFVVMLDHKPYLVLSTEVEPTWQRGDLRVVDEGRVGAEVDIEALPQMLSARQDRSVVLYGSRGVLGFGEVGAPELIAQLDGDLPMLLPDAAADAYYEALESGDEPPTLPPNVIWDGGRQLLIAPIETSVSDAVVWARDAELPSPRVLVPTTDHEDDVPSLGTAQRLLEHSEARQLAQRLRRDQPESAPPLQERVELMTWRDDTGAVAAQTAWLDGPEFGHCGLESAPVWSGVEITQDGSVRPLPWLSQERVVGPAVIADLDLDGRLDIVMPPDFHASNWTLFAGGPGDWVSLATLPEPPYYGCPC